MPMYQDEGQENCNTEYTDVATTCVAREHKFTTDSSAEVQEKRHLL